MTTMTAMRRTTSTTGKEQKDPVKASQNAELSFLDPSLASQVDYLGMMATSTNSTTTCAFLTGAPNELEKYSGRRFDISPEFDIAGGYGDRW